MASTKLKFCCQLVKQWCDCENNIQFYCVYYLTVGNFKFDETALSWYWQKFKFKIQYIVVYKTSKIGARSAT